MAAMTTTYSPDLLPPPASPPGPTPPPAKLSGSRARRLWRGRPEDPAWIRPSLIALLAGTGLLYLWNLTVSGWANEFYAAAVKAGSRSWEAMFFGSLDSSNFISVDKPPASLWVMDVSARLFGFNQWAVLAPQALEGVASVAILYLAVRRWSGPRAGLLAGLALATTPIAALMFRFDNPDALLVLLMTAAAYAIVRATQAVSMRWVALAGVLIGFAFLTKMLQGLIILPALAAVYLVAADTTLWRRIRHVLVGGVGVVVGAGWWIVAVLLTPAADRPYIGGTNHNSILELTFGYNGIGRLTGADNNGAVGGNTGGGFSSGTTGFLRLFGSDMGTQISWLLPAALISIVAGGWLTRNRPRTDGVRAAVILWGGWLLVNGLVLLLRQRHHPPLLHGGAGAADRGADRDRGDPALADAAPGLLAGRALGAARGHRLVGRAVARTRQLAPRAEVSGGGGRGRRHRGDPHPPRVLLPGRAGGRTGDRAHPHRRARRVRAPDGVDRPFGGTAHGGTVGHRRLRRWRVRRRRRRCPGWFRRRNPSRRRLRRRAGRDDR